MQKSTILIFGFACVLLGSQGVLAGTYDPCQASQSAGIPCTGNGQITQPAPASAPDSSSALDPQTGPGDVNLGTSPASDSTATPASDIPAAPRSDAAPTNSGVVDTAATVKPPTQNSGTTAASGSGSGSGSGNQSGNSDSPVKNSNPSTTSNQVDQPTIQACQAAVSGLSTSCSLTASPTTASAISLGQTLAKVVAASPEAACNGLAQFAVAAQAGVAAFNMACQQAVTACKTACTAPKDMVDGSGTMKSNLTQCQQAGAQATPDWSVLTQMMGVSQNQLSACQQANSLTSISAACLANPLAEGCAGYSASDCSNPANAGSATCQCINNPSSCSGASNASTSSSGLSGGALSGGTDGSSSTGGIGSLGSLGGLGSAPTTPGSQNQQALGGQGGGMGGGGAGASGFDNTPAVKKPVAGAKTSLPVGGSLYGGLVSPSGGGGSGSRGGGYGSPAENGKTVLGGAYVSKPDFNKFRPNMPYNPSRALAGKSSLRDGITGPETDIWDKVKTQFNYQGQQGSFIND